jgi:hypothetical protein
MISFGWTRLADMAILNEQMNKQNGWTRAYHAWILLHHWLINLYKLSIMAFPPR